LILDLQFFTCFLKLVIYSPQNLVYPKCISGCTQHLGRFCRRPCSWINVWHSWSQACGTTTTASVHDI